MVVEDLPISIFGSTWSVRESKRKRLSPKKWLSVRELSSFEENSFFVIDSTNNAVSLLRDRKQDLSVELCWLEKERSIFVHVCRPRLVQNVLTYHVRVLLESVINFCPESKHFVKKSILILV